MGNTCCQQNMDEQCDLEARPPIFEQISQDEFIKTAQMGDILLFNTKNTFAMLQRSLLATDWDHVGLVIKSDSIEDDVFILEAVSTGVRLIRWSQLSVYIGPEPDKFFAQICYRKVNFERTTAIKKKFVEFANQTIGKEYSLSVNKLARRETVINDNKAESKEEILNLMRQALANKVTNLDEKDQGYVLIKDDRTFFCSELVAKALKETGVMINDERSSASFYPKHFGSAYSEKDSGLGLTPGITIDKELEIFVGASPSATGSIAS